LDGKELKSRLRRLDKITARQGDGSQYRDGYWLPLCFLSMASVLLEKGTGKMKMKSSTVAAVACFVVCLVVATSLLAQPPKREKAAATGGADEVASEEAFDDFDGPGVFGPPNGFGPPNDEGGPGRNQPPGPPPGGFGGMQEDLNSLKSDNPELYQLMKQERDLGRRVFAAASKYRRAAKDQQSKIKEELKKLATEQFEAGQQRRELELKHRAQNKDKIIEKQVSQLLSQPNGDFRGSRRPDNGPPPGSAMGNRR
jgi:hypothetical protein